LVHDKTPLENEIDHIVVDEVDKMDKKKAHNEENE
jgi:hypothetical protein